MRAVTSAATTPPSDPAADASAGWWADLKAMASHGWAVFVGQLAVMGYGVVDTIVAGRHGELSLATLAIGAAVFITVHVSLMGLFTALLPIWAEHHGARRQAQLGPSVRQSLYVWAVACVLGMTVLLHPEPLLRWTEVPDTLRPVASQYLTVIGWSLPAALLFRIFTTLSQALGRPQLVSWLQVLSLAIKLPLSVWWTFGGLGLPGLGVVGCAWATFVVNMLLAVLALWLLRTQPLYAALGLWRWPERPHGPTLAAFVRLGVPAALTMLVEITSFTLMALLVARLGTTAAAAHQVAANLVGLLYMAPLALAVAASARVGWWRGAGQEARARAVALQAVWVVLALVLLLAGALLLGRHLVAGIYTAQTEIAALAARLLAWVAVLHIADGVQTLCIFLLRCWRVTLGPLLVYCVLLWGLGLGGGYVLAYRGIGPIAAQQSPVAFWQSGVLALFITAVLVLVMLRRVSARAVAAAGGAAGGESQP